VCDCCSIKVKVVSVSSLSLFMQYYQCRIEGASNTHHLNWQWYQYRVGICSSCYIQAMLMLMLLSCLSKIPVPVLLWFDTFKVICEGGFKNVLDWCYCTLILLLFWWDETLSLWNWAPSGPFTHLPGDIQELPRTRISPDSVAIGGVSGTPPSTAKKEVFHCCIINTYAHFWK
jgi:hypothetical protein